METSSNRFQKHPVITIVFVLLVLIGLSDLFAAFVYKLATGHSWGMRAWFRNKNVEETYRIRSDEYHHDLAPNKSVDNAIWGPITYKIRTNSLGFKDKAVRDVPLASNKHRILFIGDSFTEGVGVEYPETFVGIIDSALQKDSIEVLNAGVASYCPLIHWKKIRYLIENKKLQFNELVVFLDISDPFDEAVFYPKAFSSNQDGDVPRTVGLVGVAGEWIRENTILFYALLDGFQERILNPKQIATNCKIGLWTIDQNLFQEYGNTGLQLMAQHMDSLFALASRHGISMTVAVHPWPDQIVNHDLHSRQVTFWQKWCSEKAVHFLDFFPVFVSADSTDNSDAIIKEYYIKKDAHWSSAGHRIVAEMFLKRYEENKSVVLNNDKEANR